jgi:hypothetical protein
MWDKGHQSIFISVGDPDPDQDPHVFGPPDPLVRCGSGAAFFPFLIKVLSGLLAK